MIFKRRLSAALLVLLCGTFAASQPSDDFKFDSDDLQIVYSDPSEAVMPPSRYLYSKEIALCPAGESKMMLTLLLQSLRWSDVTERKREKAIKKLSRFFLVPKQFITVSDIHTPEILEMLKHSINKSNNLLNAKETVGRVEFMIGCGDKMFENGKKIAHQVNEFVKNGALDELSGLPINWWNIWSKHVKSRVQRMKRQVDGSGSDDYQDYEDDDEENPEEDDENPDDYSINESTEAPRQRNKLEDEITERMSTQVHETTQVPITSTLPTTTEIITNSETSTTTTTTAISIVDATLAVDQAPTTLQNLEEEKEEETLEKSDEKPREESESNYDEEYDDIPEDDLPPSISSTQRSPTTQRTTTPAPTTLPPVVTTQAPEEATTTTYPTTTQPTTRDAPNLSFSTEPSIDDYEDEGNKKPQIEKRIPKAVAIAGKPFSIVVEEGVFTDEEDKTNLELVLLDKHGQPIPSNSWIRFDKEKREIYGLPLEADVSQYQFKLRAADSQGEYVDETVDITVQQHKGFRSVNHEIYILVKLEKEYESAVDWEIRLLQGIVEAVEDESLASMVVREVRPHKYESNMFTFVFTNETLPKDKCPKAELDELMQRMTKQKLNKEMSREITVRNIEKELIGACQERVPPKPVVPTSTKNYPPTVRNPVDRVVAHAGQLLVFEVPKDTFYDPEDQTDLKLSLLNEDRSKLSPDNWLQFDTKNREFYGVPTHDVKKQQNYVLVAEDKSGLTTNDALVVEVDHSNFNRELSATFKFQLDIAVNHFQNAGVKRKFIETIQKIFGDLTTENIIVKVANKVQYAGRTAVVVQNTTLNHQNFPKCPHDEIERLKSVLLRKDNSIRDEIKEEFKSDFPVMHISVTPAGNCIGDSIHHPEPGHIPKSDDIESPIINQDVLITYVLPTTIILLMLLIALLIACLLYKRRNTGKMELGDEEERKSFRSKGIPVIFQDELEEKPEIVTKSPIILKDEKPPLLPQYNGMSQDGDEDNMDQYIPPQPVMMGSRESRGKSPVTPSYRRPPPYVSP